MKRVFRTQYIGKTVLSPYPSCTSFKVSVIIGSVYTNYLYGYTDLIVQQNMINPHAYLNMRFTDTRVSLKF